MGIKFTPCFYRELTITYNREFIAGECAQNTSENLIVNTGCSSEVYLGPCQTFLSEPFGKKWLRAVKLAGYVTIFTKALHCRRLTGS